METADEMARLREEETRARAKIDERLLSAYSPHPLQRPQRTGRRYRKAGCLRRLFQPDTAAAAVRNQGRTRKSSYANTAARILVSDELRPRRGRRRPSARQQKDENREHPNGGVLRFSFQPLPPPGLLLFRAAYIRHPTATGNRETLPDKIPHPETETARSVTNPQLRPTNSH